MTEIPMKMYWMGEDIDTLPRERLLEVIRTMARELESARALTRHTIALGRAFEAAHARS